MVATATAVETVEGLKKTARADYRALVHSMSYGKRVSPDKSRQVLFAIGKNLDDLAEDVRLFDQRLGWSKSIAREAELAAGLQEAEATLAKGKEALATKEAEALAALEPLRKEVGKLETTAEDLRAARHVERLKLGRANLAKTASAELLAELREAEQRKGELRRVVDSPKHVVKVLRSERTGKRFFKLWEAIEKQAEAAGQTIADLDASTARNLQGQLLTQDEKEALQRTLAKISAAEEASKKAKPELAKVKARIAELEAECLRPENGEYGGSAG